MRLHQGLAFTNAALTAVSVSCAIAGRLAIRKRRVQTHKTLMIAAFVFASIFMVTFVTRIVLYGVTTYHTGQGAMKIVYLLFAGSHDAVAVISCPLVILSLVLGLKGNIRLHKQIAEVAYPVWLYSAFTGMTLYVLLYVL